MLRIVIISHLKFIINIGLNVICQSMCRELCICHRVGCPSNIKLTPLKFTKVMLVELDNNIEKELAIQRIVI